MTNPNTKALLSFTDASDANLATLATKVDNNLTGNTYFPLVQSLLPKFAPAIAEFNQLLAVAKGGSRVQIEEKNVARAALIDLLREACRVVNFDANGDRLKLLSSGYEITSDSKKSTVSASVHALKAA